MNQLGPVLPDSGDESRYEPPVGRSAAKRPEILRVLLVDDHPIVREGLATLVRDRPGLDLVGEAGDGIEAMEMAEQLHPDLILMDVTMPRMNGIEATRRIVLALPRTMVIGLSIHEESAVATAMISAGAEAYLRKDLATDSLMDVVQTCRDRRVARSSE